MRATADTTGTTLTVARNIGGTTHQIADNAELFVAGFAAAENDDVGTAITFDATVASNYTQIFRTAFGVSNTLKSTYLRTGDKEDEAMTKALKLHMSDIERAMFFGVKAEDNGSSAPRRYTGGLTTTLTTVIDCDSDIDGDGSMSEAQFDEELIKTVFKYGSSEKIAFCGYKVAAHLQEFGKDRWRPESVQGAYGVNLTRYNTFAGDLMVHLHPQFRQIPGMDDAMVIVDFPYLKYRHLDGRDTALYENRQGNGVDGVIHEYLTECGWNSCKTRPTSTLRTGRPTHRTTRPYDECKFRGGSTGYHPFFIGDFNVRDRDQKKPAAKKKAAAPKAAPKHGGGYFYFA